MLIGLSVVLFGLCLVLDALVLLSDFFALSKLRLERLATFLVRCLHVLNVLCLELLDRFDLLISKQLRVGFAMIFELLDFLQRRSRADNSHLMTIQRAQRTNNQRDANSVSWIGSTTTCMKIAHAPACCLREDL